MSNQGDTEGSKTAIRRLDDETIAAVAAAEVITRPADVVAELIENALDAGADRIDISVTGDGTDQLSVRDNGRGMSKQDAILAVQRHTTSKINTTKQASGEITPTTQDGTVPPVETLGFRGEALASIATVGTLKIETNNGGPRGTIIKTNGPTAESVEPTGRACGTTVTVGNLFETVPARQESLASPQAEFARISKLVSRYALLHPMTAISLQHDGNDVLSTSGDGYTSALLGVYDRDIAAQSTTIESTQTVDIETQSDHTTQTATIDIDGVLVHPTITRASRDALSIAIDGRPVNNETLATAIIDGYGDLLPTGQHPIAAITVSLPGSLTDHNVHPRKQTVRIQTADLIADMIETSVSDALSTVDQRQIDTFSTEFDVSFEPLTHSDSGQTSSAAVADADVLGQFQELYILCSLDETLLIVDQHAAHERITYERLCATLDETLPTAVVDPPVTVSLTPGQHAVLDSLTDQLTTYGYEYTTDNSDKRTIRVHSVPAPLGQPAAPVSIRDAIDTLQTDDTPSVADERNDTLAEVACHQSLRAGEILDSSAADELLSQLGACENPYACPHGRPVVLTIDEIDFVRAFGRRNTRRS